MGSRGCGLWREGVSSENKGVSNKSAGGGQPAVSSLAEARFSGYADVLERISPCVVSIATNKLQAEQQQRMQRRGGGERRSLPFPFQQQQPSPFQAEMALGSGVIVRSDGIVITNNHVISRAHDITITLSNEKQYQAKIVLQDQENDLAALQIEGGSNFSAITIGCADECRVGDVVLAIGNNLGFKGTVTDGIISAIAPGNQILPSHANDPSHQKRVLPVLQTNAQINPGSSGGALVNIKGALIGINTAIASPSGGNVGLGFAVPSNFILPLLRTIDQKQLSGRISRPWDGLSVEKITTNKKHVRVTDVDKDSPAAKAGMKEGDILVKLNGRGLLSIDHYTMRLASCPIGKNVSYGILRDGKTINVDVKIQDLPTYEARKWRISGAGIPLAGCVVRERRYPFAGVEIDEVEEGSNAAYRGFLPGDQIVAVNNIPVKNVQDLQKALEKFFEEGRQMQVKVRRGPRVGQLDVNPRGDRGERKRYFGGPPRSRM